MPSNVGSQTVSILYNAQALSGTVNNRHLDIRKTGIYSGGYLTPVTNTSVTLTALICEISDGIYQVKIQTGAVVTVVVGVAVPYVVLRWVYTGSSSADYMDFIGVASPAANDLVVGKCVFAGSTLTGFVYTERATPNTQDLFLKVEATPDTELRVRIRAGQIQSGKQTFAIPDQLSTLFVPPPSDSRVYLVYINGLTGAIAIDSSGTVAASPAAPNYSGKLVLAEVILAVGATNILAVDITDVRGFVGSNYPVDGSSIVVNSDGELQAGFVPIVYVGGEERTAPDGRIEKIGSVVVSGSPKAIIFATPFPSITEHVFLSLQGTSGSSSVDLRWYNTSVAGFTINAGPLSAVTVHWWAIGR